MCWATREAKNSLCWLHKYVKKYIAYLLLVPFVILLISIWVNVRILNNMKAAANSRGFQARIEMVDSVITNNESTIEDVRKFVIYENSLENQVVRLYDANLKPITPRPDDTTTIANITRVDSAELYKTMRTDYDKVYFARHTVGLEVRGYQRKFTKNDKDYHLVFVALQSPTTVMAGEAYKDAEKILGFNSIISFVLNIALVCAFLYYEKARRYKD